jgi:hypothetical protein
LFGQPTAESAGGQAPTWQVALAGPGAARLGFSGWHWLVPAMAACVLALLAVSRQHNAFNPLVGPMPASLMATVAVSSPNLATYVMVASHSPHNACPRATFDWTNGSHSLTTAAPAWNTNGLIQ